MVKGNITSISGIAGFSSKCYDTEASKKWVEVRNGLIEGYRNLDTMSEIKKPIIKFFKKFEIDEREHSLIDMSMDFFRHELRHPEVPPNTIKIKGIFQAINKYLKREISYK